MSECLIAMAVYDTDENKRTEYTERTISSLLSTTDHENTRIFIIDNCSCLKTKKILKECSKIDNITIIYNKDNLGTAEAINLALKKRQSDEYCVKIDNDVVIHENNWVEKMIRCFENDSELGILGLKRKDLPNSPDSEEYKTGLMFLPHKLGEPWNIIELCQDIIGTCTMFNPKFLDRIGYLYQPGIYGFDDVLACERSILSGFYNAFFPSVEIDHIDDGKNPFTDWKRKYAGIYLPKINEIKEGYRTGEIPIYYNPFA